MFKSFLEFVNESADSNKITVDNFLKFRPKIIALILNDENLKKGLKFTDDNINDYNSDSFVKEVIDSFLDKVNILISKHKPNMVSSAEDKGYTGYKTKGSKYEQTKDLSVKEIADLIRIELKAEFPTWKISVRSDSRKINVDIKDLPYNPYNDKADLGFKEDKDISTIRRDFNYGDTIYNDRFVKDKKRIENIVVQYNVDDSDGMIDYFSTNYYHSVDLNDNDIILKYYPEHTVYNQYKAQSLAYEERRKARNLKAKENKGVFKKGDKVIFIYDKPSRDIPMGEYKAVILKSPNGRGRLSSYDIRFEVDKKLENGKIVDRAKPAIYTTSVYNTDKLKPLPINEMFDEPALRDTYPNYKNDIKKLLNKDYTNKLDIGDEIEQYRKKHVYKDSNIDRNEVLYTELLNTLPILDEFIYKNDESTLYFYYKRKSKRYNLNIDLKISYTGDEYIISFNPEFDINKNILNLKYNKTVYGMAALKAAIKKIEIKMDRFIDIFENETGDHVFI